ncbi:hypothetical protein [Actinomadura sp. DC4]|uniref:hypothetical protein n=1 Tax=Actinomadura sp. DC4 TaxID=3055069 RepID=UPI0025B1BDC5|nr:hypothetical protein [Actinomadura sp. DC4]MDN3356826.1 hypothetical protein [Actinomadura sp. DC4]
MTTLSVMVLAKDRRDHLLQGRIATSGVAVGAGEPDTDRRSALGPAIAKQFERHEH